MVSAVAARLGCHGKVPGYGDFVEFGAEGALSGQMVQWLKLGRNIAEEKLGARFKPVYDSSLAYDLIWSSASAPLLIARITPSRDAVGRRYPLAVFANIAVQRRSLHLAVVAASRSDIAPEITSRLEASFVAATPSAVFEVIGRNQPPLHWDESEASATYDQFVNEEKGEDLWNRLFGDADHSARFTVMHGFVDTLGASRGRKAPEPRVALQFPLSPRNSGRITLEIAFWLDFTSRWLKRPLDPAYILWSVPGDEHCSASLFLFFTLPSPTQWTTLIDPTWESDTISSLDRAYGESPAEAGVAPALRELLARSTATLADYLAWAESGA